MPDTLHFPSSETSILRLHERRAVSRLCVEEGIWSAIAIEIDFPPILLILDASHPCFQGYQELSVPKALEGSAVGVLWIPCYLLSFTF